jgi:hypothetical protein
MTMMTTQRRRRYQLLYSKDPANQPVQEVCQEKYNALPQIKPEHTSFDDLFLRYITAVTEMLGKSN